MAEYLSTYCRRRYGHSKLASLIHTRTLHDRLHHHGISAYSLHPGIIHTNLQSSDPTLLGTLLRYAVTLHIIPGTMNVANGARTTLFCATSTEAAKHSGAFFVPFGKLEKEADKFMEDIGLAERLWVESERMLQESVF